MSTCFLPLLSSIRKIKSITEFLFEQTTNQDEISWNDTDWMQKDFDDNPKQKDEEVDINWLRKSLISLSPNGDYMCLAHNRRLVILQGKPDKSSTSIFDICWQGEIADDTEKISYVMCLPLVSLKKSSTGDCDWTAFVVGFTSGHLRIYTETGALIISQLFHNSAILQVTCSTFDRCAHLSHLGRVEQRDVMTILHDDVTIAVIDGFSLFQTLRACRSHYILARGMTQEPPPLACRKWKLSDQEEVTSLASQFVRQPTPLQRVIDFSTSGSDELKAAMTQHVTTGRDHFIGFYYAAEDNVKPIMSLVASQLTKQASQLLGAASGWIKWGGEDQKKLPKMESSVNLAKHSSVSDPRRRGSKVVVAPGKRGLVAVTDNFGRVSLLDLQTRALLRMWKGYRDAEVGFVYQEDDSKTSTGSHQVALFIVIYAPKRGIIEVWSCVHGPRVAAFNVSKHDRLLFPGEHGMLGMNLEKSLSSSPLLQCCLLDSRGRLHTIIIPFHLALSDANSNRAHDLHLLRKISQLLHKKQRDGDELVELVMKMRLCGMQRQAVVKMLQAKRISSKIFQKLLNQLLNKYQKATNKEEEDFARLLIIKRDLIKVFDAISDLNRNFQPLYKSYDWQRHVQQMCDVLEAREEEVGSCVGVMRSYWEALPKKTIRFETPNVPEMKITDFLNSFKVDQQQIFIISTSSPLGGFLFHQSLFGRDGDAITLLKIIRSNIPTLPPEQLLKLALYHWQDSEEDICGDYSRLKQIAELLLSDVTDASRCFDEVRAEIVAVSNKPLATYVITYVIRALMTRNHVTEDEWESLCPEVEKWRMIGQQLEDSLAFNTCILLANKCVQHVDSICNQASSLVSLKDLSTNGKGYPAEVVASLSSKLPHHVLIDETKLTGPQTAFRDGLRRCQDHLPWLLSTNSIQAHCFWEEMVRWARDPASLDRLGRAIDHLDLISCQPQVKRGLALLSWPTFVQPVFAALTNLIEKVGKAPKERLCYKHVGFSDSKASEFCGHVTSLLQIISDADFDQFPQPTETTSSCHDDRIETNWVDIVGKESIVEIAQKQPCVDGYFIQMTMNLVFIVRATMEFGLRGVKPFTNLLEASNHNLLTSNLTLNFQSSHNLSHISIKISNARKSFLCNVITSAVKRIADAEDPLDAKEWIDTCVDMATELMMDKQQIQLYVIETMFSFALDRFAHEELDTFSLSESSATHLMRIVARRLAHHLKVVSPEVGVLLLAKIPPVVSSWINSQDTSQLAIPAVDFDQTLVLARRLTSFTSQIDGFSSHLIIDALLAAAGS